MDRYFLVIMITAVCVLVVSSTMLITGTDILPHAATGPAELGHWSAQRSPPKL